MNHYNPYQTLSYTAKYGSPKPKVKHTHYVVMYGDRVLTKPMYYSRCQVELKQFKMQGLIYTDKTKFKIKGV
jgi:hypothetical protein